MGLKSLITIDHQTNENQTDLERLLISANRGASGLKIKDYIKQAVQGIRNAKVYVGVNSAQASGTVTLASHIATNTVTINGAVFTCMASGAVGDQYNVGGNDTITAAALAAAINASVTALVSGYVVATSAAAIVTVTAVRPGLSANMFTLAISANGSVSGAKLTGGTDGATTSLNTYGSST